MKLGIIIPWREQPSRVKAFEHVYNWYQTNFPDTKIYLPDHPGNVWLPSHTRNDGVRMAEADGCDIVILADADSIANIDSLREAIDDAYEDGLMHNPYRYFTYLGGTDTKRYLDGIENIKLKQSRETSIWGIVVTKVSTWWELGGMDEKFMAWGAEDDAMYYAHRIIKKSPFIKHDGTAFALHHKSQMSDIKTKEIYKQNYAIYKQYLRIKDPEELLAFIKS